MLVLLLALVPLLLLLLVLVLLLCLRLVRLQVLVLPLMLPRGLLLVPLPPVGEHALQLLNSLLDRAIQVVDLLLQQLKLGPRGASKEGSSIVGTIRGTHVKKQADRQGAC